MCLTICKIQEYSTVNRKGSFKRRKHCFRSPLLSRETRSTRAFPEQFVVGGGESSALPWLLTCFAACALQTACRSPIPALLFFDESPAGCGQVGKVRMPVPSIVLVNGDLGGQFTMTLCGHLSRVWLFAAPSTVAYQTPLSMEFPRRGYWSGLPCPSLGDLPNPGIEPGIEPVSLMSFALADMFFTTSATSKPNHEVGVAQILGMKKEWALINKSFEHLQYWTVPALKKLTVNLYHGRVIILSSPLTISSRSWEYYSIFTWLHVGNKKKGSSFFSAPSFANLFSVFLQSQSIKYAHDIN